MRSLRIPKLVVFAILLAPVASAGPVDETVDTICDKYAAAICEAVCDPGGIASSTGEKVEACVNEIVDRLPIND